PGSTLFPYTTLFRSTSTATFTQLESGRILQIEASGTATIPSSGRLLMAGENAHVENAGSFNLNGTAEGIDPNGGSGQLVHNTGTFTRTGTGTSRVAVPFDNDGTVNASKGTLALTGGDGGSTRLSSTRASVGLVQFCTGTITLAT